jgi:hypothetical protein
MNKLFFFTGKSKRSEIARIAGYLDRLSEEIAVKVEVTEMYSQRSLDQNAYLWGVVYPLVLQVLPGWESEDVHEFFLEEHFGKKTLEGVTGTYTRPLKRSSKLSKKEFKEHWQFIQRYMAQRGVSIPDPSERRDAA